MRKLKPLFDKRSRDGLIEGVKNKLFKNDDVERVFNERAEICAGCELIEDDFVPISDDNEKVSGKMCGSCFCSLPMLLRQNKKKCDKKKW